MCGLGTPLPTSQQVVWGGRVTRERFETALPCPYIVAAARSTTTVAMLAARAGNAIQNCPPPRVCLAQAAGTKLRQNTEDPPPVFLQRRDNFKTLDPDTRNERLLRSWLEISFDRC